MKHTTPKATLESLTSPRKTGGLKSAPDQPAVLNRKKRKTGTEGWRAYVGWEIWAYVKLFRCVRVSMYAQKGMQPDKFVKSEVLPLVYPASQRSHGRECGVYWNSQHHGGCVLGFCFFGIVASIGTAMCVVPFVQHLCPESTKLQLFFVSKKT